MYRQETTYWLQDRCYQTKITRIESLQQARPCSQMKSDKPAVAQISVVNNAETGEAALEL